MRPSYKSKHGSEEMSYRREKEAQREAYRTLTSVKESSQVAEEMQSESDHELNLAGLSVSSDPNVCLCMVGDNEE